MINVPFKYQTNPKAYTPKGMPKVRMPKIKSIEVKQPKLTRITDLKRFIK